jgi:integrase/recombinase XerD
MTSLTLSRGLTITDPINELIDRFISNQDVRDASKRLYKRTVELFFSWVGKRYLDRSQLTRETILEYKEDLIASGMSVLTISSYLTSVRRFYEWAETVRLYPNIARGIKTPRRKQQFKKSALHPTQVKELLEQQASLRDHAILNLLVRTGLRTIEAVRANVDDIQFKNGQRVLLVHGKGRDEKDNFVVLTDKAWLPIEAYLTQRGRVKSGEPLFISDSNNSKGKRLTTRTISAIAKGNLKAIGLNSREFTAHSLRHTTAVTILRAGGSLELAQGTLRHSNPATTQIYTASINEERRLANSGEALLDSLF